MVVDRLLAQVLGPAWHLNCPHLSTSINSQRLLVRVATNFLLAASRQRQRPARYNGN
jgi:hypothetical protein